MRCALINEQTSIVENLIMADPMTDPAPTGYFLLELEDTNPASIGWLWNGTELMDPSPQPVDPE